MLKWNRSLSILLAAFFALSLVSTFSLLVSPARAYVPAVTSLTYDIRVACCVDNPPSECWLIVTIGHERSSASDYVDKIEVEWNSTVTEVSAPGADVQQTDVFEEQVNLGNNTVIEQTESKARVRAHSTVDGWGAWSESFVMPEFTGIFSMLVLAACAAMVAFLKLRKPFRKQL